MWQKGASLRRREETQASAVTVISLWMPVIFSASPALYFASIPTTPQLLFSKKSNNDTVNHNSFKKRYVQLFITEWIELLVANVACPSQPKALFYIRLCGKRQLLARFCKPPLNHQLHLLYFEGSPHIL